MRVCSCTMLTHDKIQMMIRWDKPSTAPIPPHLSSNQAGSLCMLLRQQRSLFRLSTHNKMQMMMIRWDKRSRTPIPPHLSSNQVSSLCMYFRQPRSLFQRHKVSSLSTHNQMMIRWDKPSTAPIPPHLRSNQSSRESIFLRLQRSLFQWHKVSRLSTHKKIQMMIRLGRECIRCLLDSIHYCMSIIDGILIISNIDAHYLIVYETLLFCCSIDGSNSIAQRITLSLSYDTLFTSSNILRVREVALSTATKPFPQF